MASIARCLPDGTEIRVCAPSFSDPVSTTASSLAARALATSALRLLRTLDAIHRISEDEFALVLPTTWIEQADIPVARISGISHADWAGSYLNC